MCAECVQVVVRGIEMDERRKEVSSDDVRKSFSILVFLQYDLAIERPYRLR